MAGRGNPNWGKPTQPVPVLPTQFEVEVERLGLSPTEYVGSAQLRRWCERNRNRVYVPEWLLRTWKMQVEAGLAALPKHGPIVPIESNLRR
jgi:hypothetical protein